MTYRLTLAALLLISAATAASAEEESVGLPVPALSVGAAQVSSPESTADRSAPAADRSENRETIDCFYEWNHNEPACTADSTKKSARP
ncbi:MAG: hypothetical protein ACLGHO_05140 [Gammaproteobacteria bacterium]